MSLTRINSGGVVDGSIAAADLAATAVTDKLGFTPQDALVSGTSIKTVNSTSLLGSGDVAVGTVTVASVATANGFAGTVATATTTPAITITTSVTGILKGNGTAISAAAAGTDYQAPLVSATNIKTINGSSVLGSGDLTVGGVANLTRSARTSNTILAAGDKGTLIDITSGTFTQTLTAAATLGAGWWCYLANTGTGTVTVDPNASELIGGVATATLRPGDVWLISCTGTAFDLMRLAGNTVVVLTSGTSYTVEAGVYKLDVELWGGGGSGGADSGGLMRASAGGAGAYCSGQLSVTPGQVIACGVGAGGAATTQNSGNPGSAGGNTTFSTLTANGGKGGPIYTSSTSSLIAMGGQASGGSVNINGGAGFSAANSSQNLAFSIGGASPLGGTGGAISLQSFPNIQSPAIPGGGGAATFNGMGTDGQAGARGEIRVRFI